MVYEKDHRAKCQESSNGNVAETQRLTRVCCTGYIYLINRAGGPYRKKNIPEVLSSAILKTKGTVFSQTDRPRSVNNFFFFCLFALFSAGTCVRVYV